MFIELSENNSEFIEKLAKRMEEEFEGILPKRSKYDTLVNDIFRIYQEFLPFLLVIGYNYQVGILNQEAMKCEQN